MSKQAYTMSEAVKWTRQLATALECLSSSLQPGPIVHGDIKPDNLLICTSGDLVLTGLQCATWEGLPEALRLSDNAPGDSAFIPPEARAGADVDGEDATAYLERVGGGNLDVWSLGGVAYLLGICKEPRDYQAMMAEVDDVAGRSDASEWLLAELHGRWPDAGAAEVQVLAEVISGSLRHGLHKRLSARDVMELMEPGMHCQRFALTHALHVE